jgi:hypothetical protein
MYCRFCTRKRKLADSHTHPTLGDIDDAIEEIIDYNETVSSRRENNGSKEQTVIGDVIISGDMDKSQFEKASNFESKKWLNFSDSEWYGKIREFFGGQKQAQMKYLI